MAVVAAFLVPGHPLPLLKPDNRPWVPLMRGYAAAASALDEARPDVVVAYSTQWIAVLDELWQTRSRLTGLHVDENWYEFGDLPFDISIDTALAHACVQGSKEIGVNAKAVDFADFPVDTGTIVMANSLDPKRRLKFVLAANNLYHDWDTTTRLGAMAVRKANEQGKRVALVGVGGLSGAIFRTEIDIEKDRLASSDDDAWNRKLLSVLEAGTGNQTKDVLGEYVKVAKPDMGMKHLAWVFGGLGEQYARGKVLGYGPAYGSGAAVVQFAVRRV